LAFFSRAGGFSLPGYVTPSTNTVLKNKLPPWDYGVGSDPIPVQAPTNPKTDRFDFGVQIAWDVKKLPLKDARNYRFQIMAHDGDSTKVGGDIGEACVNVIVQCDAGFKDAPGQTSCSACDVTPLPGDGKWTWFCTPLTVPLPGADSPIANPYNLVKIPVSKLSTDPFKTYVADGMVAALAVLLFCCFRVVFLLLLLRFDLFLTSRHRLYSQGGPVRQVRLCDHVRLQAHHHSVPAQLLRQRQVRLHQGSVHVLPAGRAAVEHHHVLPDFGANQRPDAAANACPDTVPIQVPERLLFPRHLQRKQRRLRLSAAIQRSAVQRHRLLPAEDASAYASADQSAEEVSERLLLARPLQLCEWTVRLPSAIQCGALQLHRLLFAPNASANACAHPCAYYACAD
jgi:hypothetical protein